jgi:arabinogalactan oligomer/maltooligosaccharide transport system permease protein
MLTRHDRVPTGAYVRAAVVTIAVAVGALWLMRRLLQDGLVLLASTIGAVTVFLLVVYLRRRYSAMRWIAIGVALAAVFGVYPILYNVYIGFTNMGNGHLLSKQQSIERLEGEQFLAEDAASFEWAGYRSDGSFGILLVDAEPPRFATDAGDDEEVELAGGEPPETIGDYTLLAPNQVLPIIDNIAQLDFGDPESPVRIQSFREAAAAQQRYSYDAGTDSITDLSTDVVYEEREGSWVAPDGTRLVPGYVSLVGADNFDRYLSNEKLRSPLVRVIVWNFAFALLSVAFSFAVGLIVSLLFDDLPGRRIIRALLIVPYPIPVLVSVLIWRAMLNPDLGTIGEVLTKLFGSSPQFFLEPMWTRVALIVVNVWLSYPYFYVVTSGGLRAIPGELYDAAEVDGAGPWQRFRHITFPQLLVIVMPLLIASFTFNFNNFNLVYIFNFGDPPMAGTTVPIGHSDLLISFIYKLAFASSSTADYALGAAISVALFVVVGTITLLQIRATKVFEEQR